MSQPTSKACCEGADCEILLLTPVRTSFLQRTEAAIAERCGHNMMDPGVTELLQKHKGFFEVQDNGRLVCTLNEHSLPPSRHALETFVK